MQEISVNSVEILADVLASFPGDDVLFRGQTGHYMLADGSVSLPSSFARKGCIPPLMRKWIFYATELIRPGAPQVDPLQVPPEYVQALLQHYGWRSFFVDLTSLSAVAAWFAGHKFQMGGTLQMSEDCDEVGVLLFHDFATYEEHVGEAHLYVLSKSKLELAGHRLFDLSGMTSDFRSRPKAQAAWLAGPLAARNASLNGGAVLAHIEGPAQVFRDLAHSHGYVNTLSVFPSQKEDHILRHLLGLPWETVPDRPTDAPIIYRRALPLPDYEADFVKFLPPRQAFTEPFWVADERPPVLADALFIRMPELAFYGRISAAERAFGAVVDLVRPGRPVVIECPKLVVLPHQWDGIEYMKGVVVEAKDAGVFHISELEVGYAGTIRTGVGQNAGYTYRKRDHGLERIEASGDCPCGDWARHDYHLDILAICAHELAETRTRQIDDRNLVVLNMAN